MCSFAISDGPVTTPARITNSLHSDQALAWLFNSELRDSSHLLVQMFRLQMGVELCHLFECVAHEFGDFVKAHASHGEISSKRMPEGVKSSFGTQSGFFLCVT